MTWVKDVPPARAPCSGPLFTSGGMPPTDHKIWLIPAPIPAMDRAQVLRTRKSIPDRTGTPFTGGSRFFWGRNQKRRQVLGRGPCTVLRPPDAFLTGRPVAGRAPSRDPCEPLLPRRTRRPLRSRIALFPAGATSLGPTTVAFVRLLSGSRPACTRRSPARARRPLRPSGVLRSGAVREGSARKGESHKGNRGCGPRFWWISS